MQTSSAGDAVDWQQPRGGSRKRQHSNDDHFNDEQHYLGSQPQVHSDEEDSMSGSFGSDAGEDDDLNPPKDLMRRKMSMDTPLWVIMPFTLLVLPVKGPHMW